MQNKERGKISTKNRPLQYKKKVNYIFKRYIVFDYETVELKFETEMNANLWKGAFLAHGVIHEEIDEVFNFDID